MPSSNKKQSGRVLTYDGHRAMQRPRMVVFEGVHYEVVECESLYISTGIHSNCPVKRGFHVRCLGGRQFRLELTEGVGWQIETVPGPFSIPGE
ncbi:MAG: hypothetical protein JXR76_25070 [Deltaproteobacteria bacterium]|nr:hypothetical protein [Deltaproteobacteria bacterium]